VNKEFQELQELLEERGQGVPADEYFEEFLSDFHRRQRQDLMRRSARSLLLERMGVWLQEMGGAKWIYGAGAAYALVIVSLFAWPRGNASKEGIEPVSLEVPEQKVLHFESERSGKKENEPPKATEF
jgi:hypothetical protein|tara:strand:+ start:30062 stop:30442 length:381 start_codon:yes stop_codon:yes gene_type:complete